MRPTHYSSYTICKDLNLILCNYQGESTINDVIKLNKQLMEDPQYDLTFNILIDFSACRAIAFKIEIPDYINFFKKSVQLKNKAKVGILYSTPNQSFLLHVYKNLGKLINHDVELFKSFEEYISWMNFDEEQAAKISETLISIKSDSRELSVY